jgi:hypothetical protein
VASGKTAARRRPGKKRSKRVGSPKDAEGELQALHIATGFAIQSAGLVDDYDPTGPMLIKTSQIKAEAIERLNARALQAAADLMAGRSVEPSLDLALYLASKNEPRLAGAVYIAYWNKVSSLNIRVAAERDKNFSAYYASFATDRKREQANEFSKAVASEFEKLLTEHRAKGRQLVDESCRAIAGWIRERQRCGQSVRTVSGYVEPLLRALKAK